MKKLNKKGFTLTELLATIVILSVVVTIAVPSVIGVSNLIKENMYKSKIKLVEKSAKLYGEDGNVGCIQIKELCNKDYIKPDKGLSESECLENPKDGNIIGEHYIKIEEHSSGRVKATYKGTNCS